jgi:hypothetical protein
MSARKKFGWGGARPGAGRPRSPDSGAPHTPRPRVRRSDVVRLDFEFSESHPASAPRSRRTVRAVLREVIETAQCRFGFIVSEWDLKGGTLSVSGFGANTADLSRAAQGLGVRVARNINARLGTSGKLFADRYRLAVL